MGLHRIIGAVLITVLSIMIVVSCVVPATSEGAKTNLYVFGIFGQSNAAYGHVDVEEVNENIPAIKSGTAFYFGNSDGPILYYDGASVDDCDMCDMCPDGSWTIGNFEPSFAQAMASQGKSTYLINVGIPGRPLSNLKPGTTYWDWESDVMTTALSKIDHSAYNIIMCSVIWVHGEADNSLSTTLDAYKSGFLSMYSTIEQTWGFDSCLITLVRDARGTTIGEAEEQLVQENDSILMGCDATSTFTVDNGMMEDDNLHYTQSADNIIGKDNADTWIGSAFNVYHAGDLKVDGIGLIKIVPIIIIAALLSGLAATIIRNRDY